MGRKLFKTFFVFLLIFFWLLAGFPVIWQNPRIPPKIQEARAETLSLYVNSFDAADNDWTNVGTSPYLGAQDQPTDYIYSTGRNKNSGNYGFADISQTGTINSVYLYIYAYGVATTNFTTILSGIDTGLGPPAGSWAWKSVNVSAILTTWDAINAATILFDRPNTTANAGVDAAYLYVDYTPAAVVSVSISDGSVDYGIMPANTSKSTLLGELNDMQTATNNGNVIENFNIKGQDASGGGCTWTLAATNGNNQYVHQFCNDTDYDCTSPPTNYTILTTGYQPLDTGIAQSGTVDFQLRIIVPDSSSCYTQQSVDVTIQAVQ